MNQHSCGLLFRFWISRINVVRYIIEILPKTTVNRPLEAAVPSTVFAGPFHSH